LLQAIKNVLPNKIKTMNDALQQPGLNSLSKSFEPAAIEAHWGPLWERRQYGLAGYRGSKVAKDGAPSFAIQLPPPNVTGTLHMGHAFNQTIMDSLTRMHRMRGDNTVWIPGTDHAGIATQIVVERQLQDQKISRHDLGRKNFVAKVWEWIDKSGNTIPRCAAWATASTGVVNISPWTKNCPKR
jgi:valyl-tRNA synthetase